MSFEATDVCRHAQVSPSQKAVLMCIADHANKEDGIAWPSIAGICDWTCLGRTAVIEAMKQLEAKGLVSIEKATGRNNRCSIDLERIRAQFPPRQPISNQSGARTSPANEPVRETDYHPSATRTTTRPAAGPTSPADGPEPSITITQPSNNHSATTPKVARRVSDDRFSEFWAAWPDTDRKSRRKDCLAKWQRKGCDAKADTILAHVRAMAATRKWRDGFEPAPLTYLNAECWLDGVPSDGGRLSAANPMHANDMFEGAT